VLASVSLVAVPATAAAAPCPNQATLGTLIDAPAYERAVVCLVNRERSAAGRRPLWVDQRLRRAATQYAAKLVAGGFFAHDSPDGTSVLSRLQAVGYLEDATDWDLAENLIWARGMLNTPEAIVQAWAASPPHRDNMLAPGFREIGVGVAGGTPLAPLDPTSITVASEYGVMLPRPARSRKKGKRKRG
jgi:uncharacterized protein YkwD